MKCLSLPVSVILLLAGLAFAHESNHRGNRSICGLSSVWSYDNDEEAQKKMQKMLDLFEDNDDIQNVWHNWEME